MSTATRGVRNPSRNAVEFSINPVLLRIAFATSQDPRSFRAVFLQEMFRIKSLFIGHNVRKATNEGRADYIPVFLSETPLLFRRGVIPLDVAMVQVGEH